MAQPRARPSPSRGPARSFTASYSTSALAAGVRSVAASYLGNLVYLASSATPIAVNVADFSLAVNPASIALAPGGSGSAILTVSTADGFAGQVNLACAPPAGATGVTCSASPSAVTLAAGVPSQTSTITITTIAPQANAAPALGGTLLAAILLLAAPSRRLRRASVLAIALLVLAGGAVSCGGGGGGGGGGATAVSSATPPGNYAITVNATSGSIAHAITVSLAVQ